MANLTDYTLLGSSLFTAGAATAAWASAAQSRQDAQERRQPALLGAVTQLEGPGVGRSTPTSFNILNAGGTARNVACLLAIGGRYFTNPMGPGFLRYKQEAGARADMPPSSDRRGILMCMDLKQKVWVWDLDRNVRTYDASEVDPASDFEAFWRDFYDENLSHLERIGSDVIIESMSAGERHISNPRGKSITAGASSAGGRALPKRK